MAEFRQLIIGTEAPAPSAEDDDPNEILLNALRVYVPIWFVGFVVYCVLRKTNPRTFATRQWVKEIRTPLADDQLGWISWIWKVYSFKTDVLLHEIGLDALCFLRLVNMGFRLSCVGVLNSLWLIPMYGTAAESFNDVTDLGVNVLPENSLRFIGTVLASYIFFGYCFYTILKEFRWFVNMRHIWLTKFTAPNYTILVRNIPEYLRSDIGLYEHFGMLYGRERVQESHCCLFLNDLEGMVGKRRNCVASLEHAMAEFEMKGKRPQHVPIQNTAKRLKRESATVDSIEYYQKELHRLNTKISERIDAIEIRGRRELLLKTQTFGNFRSRRKTNDSLQNTRVTFSQNDNSSRGSSFHSAEELDNDVSEGNDLSQEVETSANGLKELREMTSAVSREAREALVLVANATHVNATNNVKKHFKQAKTTINAAMERANAALIGVKDGTPDDAGFVTFNSLVAMHAALQMKQHPAFFALETEIAPDPDDIYWGNVGKDREVLQTGRLISIGLTVTLCLFWTFLVTSVVALADPDQISGNDFLDENEWAVGALRLLSPLLLLIFHSGLLPIILKAVSRFEFPASDSLLEASAFWKMAAFTVIQTFFVSIISGPVTDNIGRIFDKPKVFVDLLAEKIPHQGVYFMQLLIVSTCIGTLVELYRVVPLFQSAVRAHIGRRLTEKERRQSVGPFKPLCVVDKIYFSRIQARFLLYYMVLFVYSSISPLVNWFCFLFFLFLGSVYRHQFIFNYPNTPDSGGQIWIMFIAVLLACAVIAQITLFGLLGLKGEHGSIALMIPLLILTSLFIVYLAQNYFSLGTYLPAHTGLYKDQDNAEDGVDFTAFRNLYKNPALMERVVQANWRIEQSAANRRLASEDEESAESFHSVEESP